MVTGVVIETATGFEETRSRVNRSVMMIQTARCIPAGGRGKCRKEVVKEMRRSEREKKTYE
jgi:hypothetical protein